MVKTSVSQFYTYWISRVFFFREGIISILPHHLYAIHISWSTDATFHYGFYDTELEYFEKKEKLCAEFATASQIRILKKQENVNNPSTKQARLS